MVGFYDYSKMTHATLDDFDSDTRTSNLGKHYYRFITLTTRQAPDLLEESKAREQCEVWGVGCERKRKKTRTGLGSRLAHLS